MSAGIAELLLLSVAAASAFAAALFSILCFVRTRSPIPALTQETVAPILRSETEIVRTAVQDQARWLRQELGQSLTSFQELMLTTFGTVRDGIDGQGPGLCVLRGRYMTLDRYITALAQSCGMRSIWASRSYDL